MVEAASQRGCSRASEETTNRRLTGDPRKRTDLSPTNVENQPETTLPEERGQSGAEIGFRWSDEPPLSARLAVDIPMGNVGQEMPRNRRSWRRAR